MQNHIFVAVVYLVLMLVEFFVCLKSSKAVYFLSCFNNAYNLHYSIHTYIENILIKLIYYYLFLFPCHFCWSLSSSILVPFLFHVSCLCACLCVYLCTMYECHKDYLQECVSRIIYRNRGLSFVSVVNRHCDQGNLKKTLLKT